MGFVQRILFFVTPVIYPVALLPANVKPFIAWQPLFPLFACYQAIFSGQTPNAVLLAETFLWAVTLVVVGGRMFIRARARVHHQDLIDPRPSDEDEEATTPWPNTAKVTASNRAAWGGSTARRSRLRWEPPSR